MSEQTNSKQSKHRNMKPTDQIGVKREALVREVCRDEVQPRSAGSHPTTTPGAILGSSTSPAILVREHHPWWEVLGMSIFIRVIVTLTMRFMRTLEKDILL